MPPTGRRSRKGCLACRKRKQQCDEEKPSCLCCRRRHVVCIYPKPNLFTASQFIVKVAGDHPTLPLDTQLDPLSIIPLQSHEIGLVCSQYTPDTRGNEHARLHHEQGPVLSLLPAPYRAVSWCDAETENLLIQYYIEVIGNSRVYVPTESNLFLHAVLPVIFHGEGPVRSMILAMSAMEWSRCFPHHIYDYSAVADRHKIKALHLLQDSLAHEDRAEENLLTCILLASMDITQGSQPTWLQHVRGALAVLHALGGQVSAASTSFARRYSQFRYILMSTTRYKRSRTPANSSLSAASIANDEILVRLAASRMATGKYNRELVDPQLGCSIEMLDYICQITILEGKASGNPPNFSAADQVRLDGIELEQKINDLPIEVCNDVDDYLRHSAECFRSAALIYLHLVIFRSSAGYIQVRILLGKLLEQLSCVISQALPRRSFPTWPLFIAGCVSILDHQRKTVLQLFDCLEHKWPVGNIYTIKKALIAIWQTRDLHVDVPRSFQPDDWQLIIERFGWKLSLS